MVSTVVNLTAFSNLAGKADIFGIELNRYFMCERFGHDPTNPCNRARFERTRSEVLAILSLGLHGILPLFNLIFVISVRDLREKCPVLFCQKKRDSVAGKDVSTGKTSRNIQLPQLIASNCKLVCMHCMYITLRVELFSNSIIII